MNTKKEVTVWFEMRPVEAAMLDLCVHINGLISKSIWIEIKLKNAWMPLTTFLYNPPFYGKESAEEFLGCSIPENLK